MKWSTSLHWARHEGAELSSRRRKTPAALLSLPRKGRESTQQQYLGACPCCAPRSTKEQTLPSPSLFIKRSNTFLFISGSWGVLELKQQLFKTLNVLENTGELKSTISLKKGKYNINPKLRSKATSSRWCCLNLGTSNFFYLQHRNTEMQFLRCWLNSKCIHSF